MTMQYQDMIIGSNSETEAALNFINGQLNHFLATGSQLDPSAAPDVKLAKKQIPDTLNLHVLMHLLFSNPQPRIRRFFLRNIRKSLQNTVKSLSREIHTGPLFYPFITKVPDKKSKVNSIKNSDLEQLCQISEALLLYQVYTDDTEYLTSGGFDIQLVLSRIWSALLDNPANLEKWDYENNSRMDLTEIASQVMRMTLDNIAYLKADHSWMYEDYRENYQFSEIKETAIWKKIINQTPGIRTECLWSALVARNGINLKDVSFQEYLKNITDRYKSGPQDNTGATMPEILAAVRNNIVLYCTGFILSGRKPSFRPVLPAGLDSYRIPLHMRNTLIELDASSLRLVIRNLSPVRLDLELTGQNTSIAGFGEISLDGTEQSGQIYFLLPGK